MRGVILRPADPDFDTDKSLGTLYMQQLQMVLRRETARMLLQGQAGHTVVEAAGEPSTLNDLLDDYERLGADYGSSPPCQQACIDAMSS